MLVLLDHCSRKNEKDPSILNNLSGEFAHKLHYFEVGHLDIVIVLKVSLISRVVEVSKVFQNLLFYYIIL
jgi:hypothetical protein